MRRPAALALGVGLLLALTGCQAETITTINVTGPGQASITMAAHFTSDAAAAILASPERLADLEANVARLSGSSVSTKIGDLDVLVSTQVPVRKVADLSSISGVAGVTATTSDGATTVSVHMAQPKQLISAIADSVKDRPDSKALAVTMAQATTVTVEVSFPGRVLAYEANGVQVHVDGSTVTASRALQDQGTASFSATGSTDSSSLMVGLLTGVIAALLCGLGVFAWWRRCPSSGSCE